jgi:hypothetical protein
VITPKQSRDLQLLERLRKSPSFTDIRNTIEVDRGAFADEARRSANASPARRKKYWMGDEAQRATDLTTLLELLDEPAGG